MPVPVPASLPPQVAVAQPMMDWPEVTYTGNNGASHTQLAVPTLAPVAATSFAFTAAAVQEAPVPAMLASANGNLQDFAQQSFETPAIADFTEADPASPPEAPSKGLLGIDDLLRQFRERYGR